MSLCDIPAPSQELVEKYDTMRGTLYKRILNAFTKLQAAAGPIIEKVAEHEHGQTAKEYVEDLQTKPQFQAAVKVVT